MSPTLTQTQMIRNVAIIPHAIQEVKQKYAPDKRLGIFDVGVQRRGSELVLTGEVDCAEARLETVRAVERTVAKVTDRIRVLPDAKLGDLVWGISCLSVDRKSVV